MITGNTTWETKLAADPKWALFVLAIPDVGIFVLSFNLTETSVTTTGGYGTSYGTAYGES